MKIDKHQVIFANIGNYLGLLVSTIGFFLVFSDNKATYGFLQFLLSTALVLVPFLNLGVNNLPVQYFRVFNHQRLGGLRFYGWLLLINMLVFLLISFPLYLFRQDVFSLLEHFDFDTELISINLTTIGVLAVCYSLTTLTSKYLTNYQHTAVPAIFHVLGNKISLFILVLTGSYTATTDSQLGVYYAIFFIAVTTILVAYAWKRSSGSLIREDPSPLNRAMFKKITSYALYTNISQIGSVLVYRIDIFMISTGIGVVFTGIYTLLLFIANTITIPAVSISSLAGPIVAKAWQEKDISRIGRLYKNTSITLTILGLALISFLWFSLPIAFSLAKNGEELANYQFVFLLLALSHFWDMTTSINAQIIAYTSLYRWNLFFMLVLGVFNATANYLLMFHYGMGILGAALATMTSMFLYNCGKLLLIWDKLGIHPFSVNTVKVIIFSLPLFLVPVAITHTSLPFYVPGFVCAGLIGVYFFPLIYWLNIDLEFSKLVDVGKAKLFNRH